MFPLFPFGVCLQERLPVALQVGPVDIDLTTDIKRSNLVESAVGR
jgi:hypothetical protein